MGRAGPGAAEHPPRTGPAALPLGCAEDALPHRPGRRATMGGGAARTRGARLRGGEGRGDGHRSPGDAGLGGGGTGAGRERAAAGGAAAGARTRGARAAGPGRGLRGVPDRPAPGRGGPAAAPAADRPRARGGGAGRRPRAGAREIGAGERVGIAWLRGTCGICRYCARGSENLCPSTAYTGWDADGGFAEDAEIDERYAHRLPDDAEPADLAPLLCAGIIGYRALLRADLPRGGRLGVYGFGASAHLAVQVALARGAVVHVVTRSARARR